MLFRSNLEVTDKIITLNKNGPATSAGGSGIEFEEDAQITSYIKLSSNRNQFNVKFPTDEKVYNMVVGDSFGNSKVSGDLDVSGNVNITGSIDISGNLAINNNKFYYEYYLQVFNNILDSINNIQNISV